MKLVSDIDLYFNQYDMETLAYTIKVWPFLTNSEKCKCRRLEFFSLLNTQKLDAEFCVKYILNGRYAHGFREQSIRDKDIFKLQPHIQAHELREAWSKFGILYNNR